MSVIPRHWRLAIVQVGFAHVADLPQGHWGWQSSTYLMLVQQNAPMQVPLRRAFLMDSWDACVPRSISTLPAPSSLHNSGAARILASHPMLLEDSGDESGDLMGLADYGHNNWSSLHDVRAG